MPRIELFARQTVKGWDCWGNETRKFNRLEAKNVQDKKLTPDEIIARLKRLEEVLTLLEIKRRTFQGIKDELLESK